MKKIMICMLFLLLMGCSETKFDGELKQVSGEVINLKEIKDKLTNYEEVIDLLGFADYYYYDSRTFDPLNLPTLFIMTYEEGYTFTVHSNNIIEISIFSSNINYDERFHVGQTIEEIISIYTYDIKTETNISNYYLEDMLYLNYRNSLDRDLSYYFNSEDNIKFYFEDDFLVRIDYIIENLYTNKVVLDERGFSRNNSGSNQFILSNMLGNKFEDDSEFKGKWTYLDCVYHIDDFEVDSRKSNHEFMDLQILDNGFVKNSYYVWSKGVLISTNEPKSDNLIYYFVKKNSYRYLVIEDSAESKFYYFK